MAKSHSAESLNGMQFYGGGGGGGGLHAFYTPSPLRTSQNGKNRTSVIRKSGSYSTGPMWSPRALERIKHTRREGMCVDEWDWRRFVGQQTLGQAQNIACNSSYNPSLPSAVYPIDGSIDVDGFCSQMANIVIE